MAKGSKRKSSCRTDVRSYSDHVFPHLIAIVEANEAVMRRVSARIVGDVKKGKSLLVFGSGHSSIFPMELYHRAGGPSFLIPVVADYLLPIAGPPVVRVLERTPAAAAMLLNRHEPRKGEMLWLSSQSGINGAVVEMALEAKKRGLFTVAFTSVAHSSAVNPRHPSGKRLFEICDEVVDLGGRVGDALVPIARDVFAGPVSTLGSVLLAHSIIVSACASLERDGVRCVYTSVNTPTGEARNREIERRAAERDPLLR